jgi:hypothetical protein
LLLKGALAASSKMMGVVLRMINAVSANAPTYMVLQHVNVKASTLKASGKRRGYSIKTETNYAPKPSLLSQKASMVSRKMVGQRMSVNCRHKNFAYQDFSINGRRKNLDLDMLKPSNALDFVIKGGGTIRKSPYYADYNSQLNTQSSFHLYRDELTEFSRIPQIRREDVSISSSFIEPKRSSSPKNQLLKAKHTKTLSSMNTALTRNRRLINKSLLLRSKEPIP